MAKRKPSPALKAFGAEVRRLREDVGITRTELANRVAVTPSYISQTESGNTRCRKDFAQRLDQALDMGDQLTQAWTKHLRSASYPKFFADYTEAEASAELLRAYEATFVVGLLQTMEYARVLLPSEPDLDGRLHRQQILTRDAPPRLVVVMDETVLMREVGNREVMREQCAHVLRMSEQENITIQIAPIAYHRGVSGSFNIATQPTREELVYLETSPGGVTSDDPGDILHVIGAFAELQANAMSVGDSRDFIGKAMDRWTM
ncbi:helix-turn-helix domain-containing protein [Actinomadura livida]|uniref:Helix-turn-helix transcriptional regulator n=1 Tax=Actinomadura livida TaxID=79909 RepID=A0A7W7IAC8_9ACTN|nr:MULTISPECIES: helix-turn-helix transcriptional regulator [Actinomadura]MBB4773354.1 transcriptional regulator with XRE-family HTH domain [Actinomadura catellatispora]GGU33636.1 transcriptional regulator [Actinomadura livida]